MRTPEEIAREHCATYFTPITGDEAVHSSLNAVCVAIEEAQKEAWNEALEDAAENAVVRYKFTETIPSGSDMPGLKRKIDIQHVVDKESVLKLKK